jgi:hypothetical protein
MRLSAPDHPANPPSADGFEELYRREYDAAGNRLG